MNGSPYKWQVCHNRPPLDTGQVHVWFVSLVVADEFQLHSLREMLTDAEQERADRFLFERHRHRFIVGRARQRQLLSLYRDVAPREIEFQYDGLGKPSFRGSQPGAGLCFNFSNSSESALLALAHDTELGVDIEKIRPLTNLEGLAERYFTTIETKQILAESGLSQQQIFFRCWTRKEAYLKAVGKGLTFPLNRVQVEIDADKPPEIIQINEDRSAAAAWNLHHLQPIEGHVGALAYDGNQNEITRMIFGS